MVEKLTLNVYINEGIEGLAIGERDNNPSS